MRKGAFYTLSDYEITKECQIINKHNNHIVKPQINGKGYGRVSIGKQLMFVHRLVAEAYVPNPENKPQVNHIDGNKLNNRADNLEWVTNQENRDHAIRHGLQAKGESFVNSKLTQKDVDYIRSHSEMKCTELAEKFGVSHSHISAIRNYKWWKD